MDSLDESADYYNRSTEGAYIQCHLALSVYMT